MSSCLSGGGGRTYRLDREIPSLLRSIPKTPSSSSNRSQSPSSSFSESSNSPLAISTKRSRTPRKRPNQIHTEAAALLSTIYPNIFTTKNLKNLSNKHAKLFKSYEDSSELLPPFPAIADSGFLLHPPEKPTIQIEPKPANSSRSQAEDQCRSNLRPIFPVEFEDGFDTESLLNQETEQGIDSIMGNSSNSSGKDYDSNNDYEKNSWVYDSSSFGPSWLGFGVNSGFEFEFGRKFKALRHVGDSDWCQFPTVDICEIMPKLKVSEKEEEEKFQPVPCLKLNYDDVLSAWSNRGSPYEIPAMGSPESASNTIAKLMQLDLFSELGNRNELMDENGVREASVLRYKEKRRTRLFSKKIRYQVLKVNSERTPRLQANRKQRF